MDREYFTLKSKHASLSLLTRKQLLLAAPIAVIAIASLLAYANWLPSGWFHAPWDKAGHGLLYGWLAACLVHTLPGAHRPWAMTLPLLVAIADEVTQSFSRVRSPDVWDLAADAVGIVLAYCLMPNTSTPKTSMPKTSMPSTS